MHHLKRCLRTGVLVGACVLPFPASTAVVIEAPDGEVAAERAPASGGQRVVPSGPLRLTCSQYGVKIADERLKNVAVSPLSAIGWLSFERAGDGGNRSVLLPFGDGGTACLISPEGGAYLKRAAAAFRAAIAENRPVVWSLSSAGASGRVAPIRTFVGADGRTCREFVQILRVDGRKETEAGTACERDKGVWRLVP